LTSATIAVLATIVVYMFSAGEFGLRLPLMALAAFLGLFFSRVSPLGPAAFVTGFVMTVALSMIDVIPNVEALTQYVLWLWVVVLLPVGLVVTANLLTGRDPADLFRHGLSARLCGAGRILLGDGDADESTRERNTDSVRWGTGALLRYLKLSGLLHKRSPRQTAANQALLARTLEVMTLVDEWMALAVSAPPLRAKAATCGDVLLAIAQSINSNAPFSQVHRVLPVERSQWEADRPAALLLGRLIDIVNLLPGLVADRIGTDSGKPADPIAKPAKRHLLIADAFTNPEHVQFAIKTTLAVCVAYIGYNLLAWPTIRTAMITCFFVTLGNVGETTHKMTLRLVGAVIGGGLGLATIVFVMPYMTSIGDLCLVIGAAAFLAAWIGTGSERLSYAGMQIAMAFFFCVLVGYGPSIDLTEARDRVVGILLGNLIVWVVFSNIWPVSAVIQAKRAFAAAITKLGDIVLLKDAETGRAPGPADTAVLAFDNALAETWRLLSFDPFELRKIKGETSMIGVEDLHAVQALLGPAMVLGSDKSLLLSAAADGGPRLETAVSNYRNALGAWLSILALQMESDLSGPSLASPPDETAVVAEFVQSATGANSARLLAEAAWYGELGRRTRTLHEVARSGLMLPDNWVLENGGAKA
jgi:multidrug resistance protein MdtO